MNLVPNEQLLLNVPFQSIKHRKKELCVDNEVQETIGVVYCPTCRNGKCVYVSTKKASSFYDCKKCKACCHVLNIPFKDQKATIMLFGGDGTHCFARKTSREYEREKPSPFFVEIFPPITVARTKKGCNEPKYEINVSVSYWLMIGATYSIFKSFCSISIYSRLTPNLHKIIMIFSVSNKGIQWSLDFGPDSVTIAVNDLDQNMTISSQEIPLAAWQLLLSQKQDFLNNHLARVPITPNQEGTMEMRDEVLSSVGAQDLDTSSYHLSDLEDIEFNWEGSQLDMDAVFRPGIDTPFSPTTFDDLLMDEGSVENPIVLGEEEDKENSPPALSPPETVRPTEPPRLQRSRPFGARIENFPVSVYRNLFH